MEAGVFFKEVRRHHLARGQTITLWAVPFVSQSGEDIDSKNVVPGFILVYEYPHVWLYFDPECWQPAEALTIETDGLPAGVARVQADRRYRQTHQSFPFFRDHVHAVNEDALLPDDPAFCNSMWIQD